MRSEKGASSRLAPFSFSGLVCIHRAATLRRSRRYDFDVTLFVQPGAKNVVAVDGFNVVPATIE
jgi:hypothetical protein